MFTLHGQLKKDTFEVTSFGLSLVLLMNDSSFPWLILVPKREGATELHQLSSAERAVLMDEIACVSRIIERVYNPDKINIGALGNMVPQLHVHVIGRFKKDRAWPGPVWGSGAARPYGNDELESELSSLRAAFNIEFPSASLP